MTERELKEKILELLEFAGGRELDIIYRILKNMIRSARD